MNSNRREFIKCTAALGAGAFFISKGAHAADDKALKMGLVGCGRRGVGAARDAILGSTNVTLTAMADVFPDMLEDGKKKLSELGEHYLVKDSHCFTGFDAFQKVLDTDVDLVMLCTPPAFRPAHLTAAIAAGKHVFMEKPAATDPAGVREIIAAADAAEKKKLNIVAGTQRRHHPVYRDILKRVHDGEIGDLVSASCYWVGDYGYYPAVLPQSGWSETEAQMRNWNYFTWLSGDHIVEQHVHNLDIMHWAFKENPIKCLGIGGRQQRTGSEFGHIFDHFAVEFEYPGGVRVTSLCRQQSDCVGRVGEYLVGTNGTSEPGKFLKNKDGIYSPKQEEDPYQAEHRHLHHAIRTGEYINEGKQIAESTLAAIMGRMACYTGQEITWDFAMNDSKESLVPANPELGPMPVPPVAVPGGQPV